MIGWHTHSGTAAAFPVENVDTDQLIPARFMSTPRSEGYGRFLLYDMARDNAGEVRPDFVTARLPDASILIARRNFGCGSSREAAVYALLDAGFRAVIAPSFGDIFASNAVNNGLLPAKVSEAEAEALLALAGDHGTAMEIDLANCSIRAGTTNVSFDLDPVWQKKLINGWDDIDLTLDEAPRIKAFRASLQQRAPWVWPQD